MRRMTTLILVAFTLFTINVTLVGGQGEVQPEIHALREVEIMNAGLLTINDTITLQAPEGAQVTVSGIKVGLNAFFIAEESTFQVWDAEGWQPLAYEETDMGSPRFRGYELRLPSTVVLEGSRTVKIRVSYFFANRVSFAAGGYSARVPVYPAATYNLTSFALNATLPEGAELKTIDSPLAFTNATEDETWIVSHRAEELRPLRNENVTITYKPSSMDDQLFDCEFLQRGIAIQTGGLRLEDTYVVMNMGKALKTLHVKLPSEATGIEARDGVGPLSITHTEPAEGEDQIDVYVEPRISLSQWARWRVTVGYSMPKRGHIEAEGGSQTLTYAAREFPHYIRSLQVVATLPEGGRFIASDPEATAVNKASGSSMQVVIDFHGIKPAESPDVSVEYSQMALWTILRPLQWAVIAAGCFGSIYVLRRRRRIEEEKPAEAKPSETEDFLGLYRERVALLAEIEDLERRIERKEVSREHFDRRSAEVTRRQRELLGQLRHLGKRIEDANPDLSDGIREIREAEAELVRVDTDLRNLEVRRRTRRVSHRDYQRSRGGHLKRRGQARRRLEQAIATIQAQA